MIGLAMTERALGWYVSDAIRTAFTETCAADMASPLKDVLAAAMLAYIESDENDPKEMRRRYLEFMTSLTAGGGSGRGSPPGPRKTGGRTHGTRSR